jgi:hypothetical protein
MRTVSTLAVICALGAVAAAAPPGKPAPAGNAADKLDIDIANCGAPVCSA